MWMSNLDGCFSDVPLPPPLRASRIFVFPSLLAVSNKKTLICKKFVCLAYICDFRLDQFKIVNPE
jgi:hypothetical protein